jgi:hypothetical protein
MKLHVAACIFLLTLHHVFDLSVCNKSEKKKTSADKKRVSLGALAAICEELFSHSRAGEIFNIKLQCPRRKS